MCARIQRKAKDRGKTIASNAATSKEKNRTLYIHTYWLHECNVKIAQSKRRYWSVLFVLLSTNAPATFCWNNFLWLCFLFFFLFLFLLFRSSKTTIRNSKQMQTTFHLDFFLFSDLRVLEQTVWLVIKDPDEAWKGKQQNKCEIISE